MSYHYVPNTPDSMAAYDKERRNLRTRLARCLRDAGRITAQIAELDAVECGGIRYEVRDLMERSNPEGEGDPLENATS